MKWQLGLLGAFLIMICLFGCEDKGAVQHKIDTVAGQEFSLTLDSNPTTGYSWHVATPPNEQVLQLLAQRYDAPQTSALGTGGQEVFTFKTIREGTTKIIFHYSRPWEVKIPPIKVETYEVTVR